MPLPKPLQSLGVAVVNISVDPADGQEQRLQKQMLAGLTVTGTVVLFIVGSIFLALNAVVAGAICLAYGLLNVVGLLRFAAGRLRPRTFAIMQIVLVLVVSTATAVALGGISNSGGVLFYGFLSPLAALLFFGRKAAAWTLLAFLLAIPAAALVSGLGLTEPVLTATESTVMLAVNTVALCIMVFATVSYFVGQRNLAYLRLEEEEKKSERLLLNILPAGVAAQLKERHSTVARYHPSASILFADVADFTPLAAGLPPTTVVDLLNEVFTEFDELVEKYGLEKIKTIGDSYMAAAGVPEPRDDHAVVTAKVACEMMDVVRRRSFQDRRLVFRIGIHSGPVVAGVIGRRKFSYDLWGDTVNTASRMEEYGLPGHIQITESTLQLLEGRFEAEFRAHIDVKGKGLMPVYVLKGPVPSPENGRPAAALPSEPLPDAPTPSSGPLPDALAQPVAETATADKDA